MSAAPVASAERAEDAQWRTLWERGQAVSLWRTGGAGIKRAAEEALLGTDEDVKKFLAAKDDIEFDDDSIDASRILSVGGLAVREAAKKALRGTPEDLRAFLKDGWKAPLEQDQQVEANQVIYFGGNGVKDAGNAALKGTPADVAQFLEVGQYKAREIDDEILVLSITAEGGPNVKAAGNLAMKGTPEDRVEFLEVGQFTARNRDQEHATIADLTKQAEQAGLRAEQATEAAQKASGRAVAASELAKESAQKAARETKAAKDDSKKAAVKAQQAAKAAQNAASAAQQAIGAANAAQRTARIAAMAAAQTASAANAAAEAATRAYNAAIAAGKDAGQAENAKNYAKQARDAAGLAKRSAAAADQARKASSAAETASKAARSAGANADAAADAADEASGYADAAGVHSAEAKAAAAETRRHAREANRAAAAAESLARKSASAAAEARDAANSAADHANKAADAAEEAAKHAGEAKDAATEAAKQADAAKEAADAAKKAVDTAKKVFEIARETEAEELATRTAAAVERAKSDQAQAAKFTSATAAQVMEDRALDGTAQGLAAEASKPGADVKAVAAKGRALAMRALKVRGPFSQEAAATALAGADDDVLEYLRTGWTQAEQDEARQRVVDLSTQSPYESVRTAAQEALRGNGQQIRDFYTTGQYTAGATDLSIETYGVLDAGGPGVKEAAKAALASKNPKDLAVFLASGQHQARNVDEQVLAAGLLNDGGPEVKAAAKVALAGPADELHSFIQAGQYMADRKDQLAATHVAQLQVLISHGSEVAAKARENQWVAARAAAVAKGASGDAQKAADQAQKSADEAKGYAADADKSARQAESSAAKAAKSAVTARNAADAADRDEAAAAESAAQSQFSASYARSAAIDASEYAGDARHSAVAAGKSAKEANDFASQAWREVVVKRQAEQAEAQRQAEEKRKQLEKEKKEKEKRRCRPGTAGSRDLDYQFQACTRGPGEWTLDTDPPDLSVMKLAMFMWGVDDVAADCVKNPSASKCSVSLVLSLPVGRVVKWGKKGVEAVAKESRAAKAAKCLECFLAGTKVLMADRSTKNIESVEVGDVVVATDPVSGKTGQRAVTGLIVTEHDKRFNELDIDTPRGTERLTATYEHPFWSPSANAWVRAAELRAGMTLRTVDGRAVRVAGNRPFAQTAKTYNLTIDDLHTYYVLAGSTPVLVHNSNCNVANARRLQARMAAEELAGADGHAYRKHVVEQGEFPGIRTRAQFAEMIEDVILNGERRVGALGRSAYWKNGVIVIRNPGSPDGGTVFAPKAGYDYFLNNFRPE
ncbi:polymorphic toxin-type HINT domain-containing protein [Streptomyces sp. URMC 124]